MAIRSTVIITNYNKISEQSHIYVLIRLKSMHDQYKNQKPIVLIIAEESYISPKYSYSVGRFL